MTIRPGLVWFGVMKLVNIQAAKTHLSRLVEEVVAGEEVVLAKSGKPLVRLVRYAQPRSRRTPGALAGQFWEAPDCWAPGPSELEASIEAPLLLEPPAPALAARLPRRLLVDSHVVVWWLCAPERLTAETRNLISSPDHEVFLSAATVWELGLKLARSKLKLQEAYAGTLLADGWRELPVTIAHGARAVHLPPLHADPFDRLLIAQALEEELVLVTADRLLAAYPIRTQVA